MSVTKQTKVRQVEELQYVVVLNEEEARYGVGSSGKISHASSTAALSAIREHGFGKSTYRVKWCPGKA